MRPGGKERAGRSLMKRGVDPTPLPFMTATAIPGYKMYI